MATAGGLPPFQRLSPDNHGPIITLISVCLLIVAVIFVLAKSGSAIYFKQRRTAGSTPIWAALVSLISQSSTQDQGLTLYCLI
jgi:lipopolysaccharide/colanic/teichoic acid biosynthesis glycosyltransferase